MRSTHGALSAGSVAGDIHLTSHFYNGIGPTTAAQPAPSMSLALPERRVAPRRLRGRDRLVAEVTDAVARRVAGDTDQHGVWLLSGMGGSGKTTVALEVAHRLTDTRTVNRVWWVSGADREGLWSALRAVAFEAGATPSDFHGKPHPADVLWRHLRGLTIPWLLVLDNIDDPAVLAAEGSRTAEGNGWLRKPADPLGTVLVTSRESLSDRWGPWVHQTGVEPLSKEDGAAVLTDLAWRAGDEAQARELAEHLGGLPLALELAGSYLARARDVPLRSQPMPKTFAAYRRSLDAHLGVMASDPDEDLPPDQRTRRAILSTFELSLDLLHRRGVRLARPLLRLLCAFGPAPVPYEELLDAGALAASDLFPEATLDELNRALLGLHGLKLITLETPPDIDDEESDEDPPRLITIHPLVRKASRAHEDFAALPLPWLRLVVELMEGVTRPLDTGNPVHWPKWAVIAPHGSAARLLLPMAELAGVADANLIRIATEPAVHTAWYQTHTGMFTEAIGELETVRTIRARWCGEEDPATVAAGLTLAWALRDGGRLRESEQWYARLADATESLPANHPYRQSVRTGRARTLAQQGRYEAAEAELNVALALRQADPEATERGILRIRADLARLAHSQGRPDEAADDLREVRRRIRDLGSPGDLELLAAGLSLVRALRDAGQATEAERLAEQVVREHRQFLAPDHPDLLVARHERARIRRDHAQDRERLEQVRDEFTDIWRTSERRFGPDHPNTIATRHELATVWYLLGSPDHAAEHFRAALAAGTERLGEHHPNVVICAHNLAGVLAGADAMGGDPPAGTLRGAAPMHDPRQILDPLRSRPADPTAPEGREHGDEEASPALTRLLDRFVRADRTVSDFNSGGGAGYSSGNYTWSSTPWSAYRPRVEEDLFTRPMQPVVLGSAARQALATGEEDRPLVERLRDQQHVARVLALRDLVERAEPLLAGRPDTLPDVKAARNLLIRADRADRQAVAALLLDPSVGRWMSRTLRELCSTTGEPADKLLTDLAHLHSVAAGAAVRAGIGFDLALPLRDGYALLPTLGAADLRAGRGDTAHIKVTGRVGRVSRGRTHAPLPHGNGEGRPPWHSVHRVRTAPGFGRLDIALEDLDPYRAPDGPLPPDPRPPSQLADWGRLIHDAGALLSRIHPQRTNALAKALTVITPRVKAPGGVVSSVSSSDAFGGAVISEPPDGVELAASLVHEFQHMKLHALLDCWPLHDECEEPDGERFYAPWRDDPRPLHGLFQGVFAFFGVVDFWRRVALIADDRTLRRAQFQLAYWRTQTGDAYTTLRSSSRLTEKGREFVRLMGDTTASWTEHPLAPDDIMTLAHEAAAAHRTRWRLHHLRPDPEAVAKLAEAWSRDAQNSTVPPVSVALHPDPDAAPSNTYAALLCRAAADPTAPQGWSASKGEPGSNGTGVDPSDLARLLGSPDKARRFAIEQITRWPHWHESWVRLGLALRRSHATQPVEDPTHTAAAAGALTHRPELVQALHSRISDLTGTPPDPVLLASWIGAGTVTPDSADLPRTDGVFKTAT
ncbi:aKG-HExxH-type peptide beta-hydroxylase [Streptomyces sp. HUCO-GS316]|uniref:aKG-HExxH-type peptide beta-hydroxylase n=1 Tax=Streptomyces sp. HUCO-GS316 TaxID=2692198 RepID=UPI00136B7F89